MKYYAYWLDGEYLNLQPNKSSALKLIRRSIKLHALFGNQLVLGDTQVTDSEAILNLFCNQEFRNFLEKENEFIQMAAFPQEKGMSLARSGLYRTRNSKWISGVFENPDLVRDLESRLPQDSFLASEVLQTDSYSVKKFLMHQNDRDRNLLSGIVWAIAHFESHPYRIRSSRNIPDTLYSKLKEAMTSNIFSQQQQYILDKTLSFVNQLPEEDKGRRSIIFKELEQGKNQIGRDYDSIKGTVVQAWNFAVADTVGAEGSSVWDLPGSVMVPLSGSKPVNAFVPLRTSILGNILDGESLPGTIYFPWDPDSLSWEKVKIAIDRTKELGTRTKAQEVLMTPLTITSTDQDKEHALTIIREHAEAIADSVLQNKDAAAGFIITLGQLIAPQFGLPDIPEELAVLIHKPFSSLMRRCEKYEITFNLRTYGEKMLNPHE
jgi:hypothetical protein